MAETGDSVGYADAMRELGGILDELERDDLDVDVLAERVKRASELIKTCRERIARAQTDVDRIVVDLESFAAGSVPEREAGSVPEREAGSVPEREAGSVPSPSPGDDLEDDS